MYPTIKRIIDLSLKTLFILILFTAILTTIIVKSSGDSDFKSPINQNIVNDVTQLNPISVAKIITPTTIDIIVDAVKNSKGQISIGGGRYSMGGQTASKDSLHIDMRQFNKVVKLDSENKTITVQPGITWRDIQEAIDPHNFSVKIMQTYANFSVGGSLSVNVHGRYIGEGPLIHSVKSIQLVLADGSIKTASPETNQELFYAAIGGYGGIGVITEATLKLADNTKIERITTPLPTSKYKDHFFKNVRNNKNVVFHNADLYPPDYNDALDVSWYTTDKELTDEARVIPRDEEYSWGPMAVEFIAEYDIGKSIRQHIIDPIYYAFDRVVWRNWEASYDVRELEPDERTETTYVLREYFIPVENFEAFIPLMRDIFNKHEANILNVSIRHAHKDSGSYLAWARKESFAFVVYYRQGTDQEARKKVAEWSKEMIDAVISLDGTYYLPYQIFASPQQFLKAYPNAPKFFKAKQKYDPNNKFTNQLWNHHYSGNNELKIIKENIKDYYRGEEQTFLTIPEWYLVFNPVEYADYLEDGNNPSDFPFFASIDEYWKLYDRVTAITQDVYPDNHEYMTMLQVIGISTTLEYMFKGFYENTIGRFTRWTASEDTEEDKIIQQAARAYSDFIYDVAWYEFDFSGWIGKIWSDTNFFGNNFIRKLERKLSFTFEYGFKSLYAKLIGFGAKTAYEQSEGLIYATISSTKQSRGKLPESVKIIEENNDSIVVSIPRWGEFTRAVPVMVNNNYKFDDISGNKSIVVTLILPANEEPDLRNASVLINSPMVSNEKLKRIVSISSVNNLHNTLLEAQKKGYKLEHIYDY